MTAITFPNSPSSGDTHTAGNGIVYTYDGEKWTSIGTNSAGTWTRSGTEVSMTNAGDDLNVDSGTLFVDASTDRVGVGTTSPLRSLHVAASGDVGLMLQTTSATDDKEIWEIQSAADASNNANLIFRQRTNDGTGGIEALRIDSSGNVGIGTTSPGGKLVISDSSTTFQFDPVGGTGNILRSLTSGGSRDALLFDASQYVYSNGATEYARIDSSGRLLVGTSSSLDTPSYYKIQATAPDAAFLILARDDSTTISNNLLGAIRFGDNGGGGNYGFGAQIDAAADTTHTSSSKPSRLVFSTTADGSSSPTERMRISRNGEATFTTPGTIGYLAQYYCNGGSNRVLAIEESSTDGVHSTSGVIRVGKTTSNSRSINATGTINASGSDYAEYMTKSGNFTINKGDICGITADGLLTNQFLDAISFVVKSTLPSYVGGDTWGLGLPEKSEELEAARQAVDRIAFAGQVPVNVTGASPGQYIVPVQTSSGGIKGIAKNEADLTLSEYMKAVGKVIANEDDGRARIIVKVS